MRQPRAAPVRTLKIASVIIGSIFGALRSLCIGLEKGEKLTLRRVSLIRWIQWNVYQHVIIFIYMSLSHWYLLATAKTFRANLVSCVATKRKIKKGPEECIQTLVREGGSQSTLNASESHSAVFREEKKKIRTHRLAGRCDSEEYEEFKESTPKIVDVGRDVDVMIHYVYKHRLTILWTSQANINPSYNITN